MTNNAGFFSPIKECIVLAGGLGTRLRSVVTDVPKCMAPVNDKPFLAYIIAYLESYGIERFIFSLGYKHEVVTQYLTLHFPRLNAELVVEDEPLGTGGAIRLACTKAQSKHVLVANGDTLFKANIGQLAQTYLAAGADCTLALKPMQNFERYGVVELDENGVVCNFKEKQWYNKGLINGGLYALQVQTFLDANAGAKFSFEKDYLEAQFKEQKMMGFVQDEYFIDIGIPADYERAQEELKTV